MIRLEKVLKTSLQDVLKMSWRRLLKTNTKDVFKTSSLRRMFAGLYVDWKSHSVVFLSWWADRVGLSYIFRKWGRGGRGVGGIPERGCWSRGNYLIPTMIYLIFYVSKIILLFTFFSNFSRFWIMSLTGRAIVSEPLVHSLSNFASLLLKVYSVI